MKIKSIIAVAAGSLMLAACQGNNGNADILKDATPGDSLVYYFGQLRGTEYVREAQSDSTLATKQAKEAYIRGVQAGLDVAKNDDEAFNRGLFLGIQMATNIKQFKTDYDVQLSKKMFVESLREVLSSDSVKNTADMQREFYRLMNDFSVKKENRDKEEAQATLAKEAAKLKMAKITDEIYGGPTDKKEGQLLKKGDAVILKVKLSDLKGNSFDVPLPTSVKIGGRNIPQPLSDALTSLRNGESGKYLTSAFALFGSRVSQLGLQPDEILVMDLTASIDTSEAAKDAE